MKSGLFSYKQTSITAPTRVLSSMLIYLIIDCEISLIVYFLGDRRVFFFLIIPQVQRGAKSNLECLKCIICRAFWLFSPSWEVRVPGLPGLRQGSANWIKTSLVAEGEMCSYKNMYILEWSVSGVDHDVDAHAYVLIWPGVNLYSLGMTFIQIIALYYRY